MVHDPYSVNARKPLTAKQRLKLLIANNGRCCICGQQIVGFRERWDDYALDQVDFIDEHIQPLWCNGTNEWGNRGPAHVKCAERKTAKEATERAKGQRAAEFHFGAKRPKRIMPGSRRSKWKKTVNHGWVRRENA